MKTKLLIILGLLTAAAVIAQVAGGVTLRAVWNANPETNIAGYRVYLSPPVASPVYSLAATVTNNLASPQWQIPRTNWGYFIYVTAFNTIGLESDPSVTLAIPDKPGRPQNITIIKE